MLTKKISIKIIALSSILLMISACDGYLEDDIESPNDPVEATPGLLLSNVQVATFAAYSGQLTRQSLVFNRQLAGTAEGSQSQEIALYNITELTNVNEWEAIWAGAVVDSRNIIRDYGADNPYYSGIAKVLLALNIGLATDLWGAVPFDQAGLGLEVDLTPAYQTQDVVLQRIQTTLDEAIVELGAESTANTFFPGADDLIFQGDVQGWIQTAWILKARYANRLSEINPSQSANDVLSYINQSGAMSPENDAFMNFFGGNAINQWRAFENDRGAYYRVSSFFVDLLTDSSTVADPRAEFFFTTDANGSYSGTPFDDQSVTSSSYVGDLYAQDNSPVPLVTYVEAKFLEAEAHLRAGSPGMAAEAYNTAVIASVEQVTGSSPSQEFIDEYASADASIALEDIMLQKYIALFVQIETYSDWRRTGVPELNPFAGAVIGGIPLRLPTPQDERLYNPNAIVVGDPLIPVYWDVN
ncbi:MAG TPA: SusD/RagB family nutrient-binding outer membrane lipoprotein [Cryomorphaceae bacterium]|nr:SusD/RagB family nutrient-binding outer membrane lipoprotein [Cryomorphaceae bacterium]